MNLSSPSQVAQLFLSQLESAAAGYAMSLFQYVRVILVALALLDLIRLAYDVWTSHQGPDAALPRLGRWVLYMAAVAALVQTSHQVTVGGDSIARYVYDLFREWGERASGLPGFTPADIWTDALVMGNKAMATVSLGSLWGSLGTTLLLILFLVVTLLVYGYLTLLFYFLFVEWFIALGLAPAFLVTAAHKWTAGIAESYVSYLVQLGYRTLAIFFCYPVAIAFTSQIRDAFEEALEASTTTPPPLPADDPSIIAIVLGACFAGALLAATITAVRAYANRVAPQGRVLNLGSVYESI
ncbi:MAG: hypothetical protein F9K16_07330 [Thermoanaerobaculia bacterium]|nr:MAG: hypothetical protein F9K16_07330 [Thermoanaerobaculia bacterium]MBZ0101112.1 type IV secretion system protein [Thermoanaerobaculia bacterium]